MKSIIVLVVLVLGTVAPLSGSDVFALQIENTDSSRIETFTFFSNGAAKKAKIFLPSGYATSKQYPAIYLADFTEQHFKIATDEFEKVIDGVAQVHELEALVVSLEDIPDIDAEPEGFKEHFEIYKDMVSYVDGHYASNPSRTFIGKGSESGIVMMALFMENKETSIFDNFIATDPSGLYLTAIIGIIEEESFPKEKSNKKLHFSFSTSNDRKRCTRLIHLIKQAQYPWLQFEYVEYTSSDYDNTYPVSFAEGIRFIFDDK